MLGFQLLDAGFQDLALTLEGGTPLGEPVLFARLFESPGLSVPAVANTLEYSSPQSFGRHVRTLLRLTAVQFRDQYDGPAMLHRFREELVLPFLPSLRQFNPLHVPPGWIGGEARRRWKEEQ